MLQENAVQELLEIARGCRQDEESIEYARQDADHVLCDFLVALGYEELVDAYWQVPKWE